MAQISLIRVDNRLIHGQVATGWISKAGADTIVVIDDKSAQNEMVCDVLLLATPPGIRLEVYTVTDAVEAWEKDQFGQGKVMVIFKSIQAACDAFSQGFVYGELQIGGTANGAGRKVIEGAISLDAKEFALLNQLSAQNVTITLQQTIQTKVTFWNDVAKHTKF